jgi:hypothetical protein
MSISSASISIPILLAIGFGVPVSHSANQQQTLTKRELKAFTASARTAADHERIAEYYRVEAKRLGAKQHEHEQELAEYYKNPVRYPSKYPTMGDHCRSLAAYYKMAALKAAAQADMHERLAQDVR